MKEPGKCQAPSMFNDKINDEPTGSPNGNSIRKNEDNQSTHGNTAKSLSERISGADFPRLKVGVLVSPRTDGLFVGTFDDALIIDLPGARAALALCDGSKSINSIASSVGILASDLIELISTLNYSSLVTFEKISNQKLLPEMQLMDWYQQSSSTGQQESMEKRLITTVYISKLNRIGFALSGILLASGVGAVISDDNRKITIEDIVGGYLRLSDVGRTRNEVLIDQSRENSQSKNVNNLSNWYRGYSTNTKNNKYIWITSNENHAKQYSEINKYSYGGNPIVDNIIFDETKHNLLNLYSYDMDDKITENDVEDFLSDVGVEYDYESLFDIMEDEIPLSRLVNKILDQIILNYDGLKIMENGIKTIYINRNLIK